MHPWDKYRDTVSIYIPLFRMSSPETLLDSITLLNNIIKGKYLSIETNKYGTNRNHMMVESL